MPFKHYIRGIEGKTEPITEPTKEFHEKPSWFGSEHVNIILTSYRRCVSWFTWNAPPQRYDYWCQYASSTYDELPPEPKEIIDSWIAQVNGDI